MEFDIDLGKVGITPGGSWNVETLYERLTLVTYNGQSFVSRSDNQGVTPGSNPAIWQLVAAKGQDGSGGGGGSVIPGTSDVIGLAFYEDGNLYWTKNGEWLLDPNGNMVRANAIDGQSAIAPNTSFKSIVFKRSNISVSTPIGGTYASPVPEGWSDGVPAGKEQLWMSTRIFSSDGNSPQQAAWTDPAPVTDTEYMDYEFSSSDNPGIPSKSSPSSAEQNPAWSNDADTTTIWMAMREVKNGAYASDSSWKVLRVKGEKGEDGTSVSIQGHLDDSSLLPLSGNTEGDGYIINGDLWVWDGDSWENAGPIQGPPGEDGRTPYIHIKYSNDGGQTFTANNGETPGDYIGIYSDYEAEDSLNPATYTWKKWKGEDGFGYEYIFKLTASDTAPDVPSTTAQRDDFVPNGWTDNPGNVSNSYPYCWVCYRKKTDGVWGNWIGSSSNAGKAGLFSHYGKDGGTGRGITSIVEKYAVSNSGTEVPSSWSNTVPELTAVNRYLWNYEVITYSDNDTISTPPAVIGTYGSGRGIESITEYYLASASSNGVTRNTTGWTENVQSVSASRPYLWNYEVITYTDGTSDTSEPFIIGHFGADGANGSPGLGISYVKEYFLISAQDSGILSTNSEWKQTPVPTPMQAKPYLWNMEVIVYTDGSEQKTLPHIAGRYGIDGADGRGISSIVNYYLATNLTNVTRSTSGWTTTPQTIGSDKRYLWNYEQINYDSGDPTYTTPVIIGVYGADASDVSYLEEVFGEDNVSGEDGALLRNLVGVTAPDNANKVVAMMNASDIGKDTTHGRLFFAAGLDGLASQVAIDAAKFKVYEDGYIVANAGRIGPFDISTQGFTREQSYSEGIIGCFLGINGFSVYTRNNSLGESKCQIWPSSIDITNDDEKIVELGYPSTKIWTPVKFFNSLTLPNVSFHTNGLIGLGENAYITGFRCDVYVVETSNAAVNMSSDYHTYVNRTYSNCTYTLPNYPHKGEEYEIFTLGGTLVAQGSSRIFSFVDGTVSSSGDAIKTLSGGYKWKVVYDGSNWLLSRN